MAEPWYDPNTFGAWFGAIAGSIVGLLGALIGTLAGILAPRGKGRALILGLMGFSCLAGVAMLGFGLYALVVGQPYGIWYGPVLVGGIGAVVFGSLIPVVRQRYAEAERRRLEGEGIRHS